MTSGKRKTQINTGLHVVRKQLTKTTRWYVYAFRGGPCIHRSEGERPLITNEIADEAARIRQSTKTSAQANNLNKIIAAYRRSPEWTRLSPRTKLDYQVELAKLSDQFGAVPLMVWNDQRLRTDIMEWRSTLAHKPRTADKAMVMLGTLLSWAVTEGYLTRNIAGGIPMLYRANRADIIWTDQDWAALKPYCSTQLWQGLRLAALTGLRLGDLIKVNWEHVGPQAIVFITAKRDKRVVIPVLPELRALLSTLNGKSGTLLKNSREQAWTVSGFGSVFQKAKAAALDNKSGFNNDLRIHDLRGTYATWLAREGLTDQEIGRIVAWSEKRVSEIRRRYVDEEHIVASLVARLGGK